MVKLSALMRATEARLHLSELPAIIGKCTRLEDLNLSESTLTRLPPELGQCTRLEHLYLNSNMLTCVPQELGALTALRTLWLDHNQLSALGPPQQQSCQAWSWNPLTWLPAGACGSRQASFLDGMTSLEVLRLHNNALREVPPCLATLPSLERVTLHHNRLRVIQDGLLPRAVELRCPLGENPNAAGQRVLDVSWNALTAIGDCAGCDMDILDVSHNALTRLPHGLCCRTLQQLDASFNALTELPANLGDMATLSRLRVRHNALTNVPPSAASLRITTWNLSHNAIASLDVLCTFQHVQRLSLASNGLVALDPRIGAMAGLLELNLNDNRLTALPAALGQLRALRRLWVARNRLTSLPGELAQCGDLAALVVSDNPELAELPAALEGLMALLEIEMDGTRIQHVRREVVLRITRFDRDAACTDVSLAERLTSWCKLLSDAQPLGQVDMRAEDCVAQLAAWVSAQLDAGRVRQLNEWLRRLANAKEFQRHQAALAESVWAMLATVLKSKDDPTWRDADADFRETFFAQIASNLEACGDRAAMALNEVYTAWRIHGLGTLGDSRARLKLAIGCAKTNALRRVVMDEYGGLRCVERMLFPEIQLRERLGLVTAVKSMLFQGAVTDMIPQLDEIARRVEETWHTHLFKFLEDNPELVPGLPQAPDNDGELHAALEALDPTTMPEYEYVQAANAVARRRESDLLRTRRAWLETMTS